MVHGQHVIKIVEDLEKEGKKERRNNNSEPFSMQSWKCKTTGAAHRVEMWDC